MSDAGLLFLQLIVPAATATVCMIARGSARVQHSIGVMGAAVALAAAAALLLRVDSVGVLAAQAGGWAAPFGITIVADRLAAGMVLISALVGLAVAVYSLRDLRDGALHWEFFPLFHLLLLGVQGSFLTGDLFNLYVWFEVMLVASFVLLTLGNRASQLEGALKYVMLNIVASALFLVGAGLIYGKLGTLNMADIAVKLQDPQEAALLHTSGVLLLAAFGLKAGLFPLFFWLPASYHTPRVAVSAVFAGLLTKVGVYALMRAYTLFFAAKFADLQALLLWVAAATMVTGVLGAAAHFEIRHGARAGAHDAFGAGGSNLLSRTSHHREDESLLCRRHRGAPARHRGTLQTRRALQTCALAGGVVFHTGVFTGWHPPLVGILGQTRGDQGGP